LCEYCFYPFSFRFGDKPLVGRKKKLKTPAGKSVSLDDFNNRDSPDDVPAPEEEDGSGDDSESSSSSSSESSSDSEEDNDSCSASEDDVDVVTNSGWYFLLSMYH
jgi:hypothetical protein